MKFLKQLVISLLLASSCQAIEMNLQSREKGKLTVKQDDDVSSTGLTQLIAGALKKTDPKIMTEVVNGTKGTFIEDFPF